MNKLFVIVERDAGLFSLIQQVISNLPRALNQSRIPVVYFGRGCSYWNPEKKVGDNNVWEYYFEPVISQFGSNCLSFDIKSFLFENPIEPGTEGYEFNRQCYISNNFGDHSELRNYCLVIPFEWNDPDPWLRNVSSRLISIFVRPHLWLKQRAENFVSQTLGNNSFLGIHIRGTDALSDAEPRLFRKGSLDYEKYFKYIDDEKKKAPNIKIFVATDSKDSVDIMKERYGADVISYATILHEEGPTAGQGPTGALMPSYFACDAKVASENGAEAVIDYLILTRCSLLIHNGASLARTVLLTKPDLPHINTHRPGFLIRIYAVVLEPRRIIRYFQSIESRLKRAKIINFEEWKKFLKHLSL
jgi:hypothetical protein